MQWTLIEEERGTGHVLFVKSGTIWPKIAGRGRKTKRE